MPGLEGGTQLVACWDADDTLGHLGQVSYEMAGQPLPSWERPLSVRHGMGETLARLAKEGFTHYVTSSGADEYVRQAIARIGLAEYFAGIYGRKTVSYGWGKLYAPVKEAAGVTDHQANMVAIGDGPGDSPIDLDGMVFVELFGRNDAGALAIEGIVRAVLKAGGGNFRRGFDVLHENGVEDVYSDYSGRIVTLDSGITFRTRIREVHPWDNDLVRTGQAPFGGSELYIPTINAVTIPEEFVKPFDLVE